VMPGHGARITVIPDARRNLQGPAMSVTGSRSSMSHSPQQQIRSQETA
jgi:hypothetical protein